MNQQKCQSHLTSKSTKQFQASLRKKSRPEKCRVSFGKPRASTREGNDDSLKLQRAGNPHVVCTAQQLPAHLHICTVLQWGCCPAGRRDGGSWGNQTLPPDPAGLTVSSYQRTYGGQTEGTWGCHGLIKSVVSGKGRSYI